MTFKGCKYDSVQFDNISILVESFSLFVPDHPFLIDTITLRL